MYIGDVMKKNNISKDIVITICALTILGLGVSFMLRGAIGLAAWDALTASLAEVINIKVGTASMIANFTLFVIQIILLGKSFKKSQYLQIPVILLFGFVVNFFYYQINTYNPTSYLGQFM